MNIEKLIARCFDSQVALREIQDLKGDASARRYRRVILNPEETSGIFSLIVMELPEDPFKSDEASNEDVSAGDVGELPFVNIARHLAEKGVRVPKIYLDATEDGALLLEDLGDRLLVREVNGRSEETVRAWYEAAVSLLADLHGKMSPIPETCVAASRKFDETLFRLELEHYREWGIEAFYGRSLSASVKSELDAAFDAFAKEAAALPSGFVHRDYQSRNLMVQGGEPCAKNLAVIDFQDALLGPRVYDLVSLLNDSYMNLSTQLKQHIIRRRAELGGIEPEALSKEFHLITVQRKLKDAGRFVFIDRVKHNPSFLPFVEKSFARAQESLAELPGHRDLKSALAAADPKRFASFV